MKECPHCKNDDERLMTWKGYGIDPESQRPSREIRVYECSVCSKTFSDYPEKK